MIFGSMNVGSTPSKRTEAHDAFTTSWVSLFNESSERTESRIAVSSELITRGKFLGLFWAMKNPALEIPKAGFCVSICGFAVT